MSFVMNRAGAETIALSEDATAALQFRIDRVHSGGGGAVSVPPGIHEIGTLELRSGVRLHLEHGASLVGSRDLGRYPLLETPSVRCYSDAHGFRSLIRAQNAHRVALTGTGTIDGRGEAFPYQGHDRDGRPRLVQMIGCSDVLVEGLHLRQSGHWMQHYLGCERLQVRGLTAYNHCQPNNDFIDVEGCRDVRISDCSSDTDDDGITLKSGCEAPTVDVVVTNCVIRSHCNGIKLGTETNGGFRNVVVSNCVIATSLQTRNIHGFPGGICGVALEIVDGGELDGVMLSNLRIEGPKVPLFIRLGDRGRPYVAGATRPSVGRVRNITISQVQGVRLGAHGCVFSGVPGHRIENLSLVDVSLEFAGGVQGRPDAATFPEKESAYPEATMFGEAPAFGFFIRHASNVTLERVKLTTSEPDARPAVVKHDVI